MLQLLVSNSLPIAPSLSPSCSNIGKYFEEQIKTDGFFLLYSCPYEDIGVKWLQGI